MTDQDISDDLKECIIDRLNVTEKEDPEDFKIAFNLVLEKLEEEDELFDFDGQNCNDIEDNYCGGWDGVSRRCECGNRRVYWELSEDKTHVYGVAY